MSISKNKLSVLFTTCVLLTIILNCTQDIEAINHLDQMLSDIFWDSIDFLTSVSNYLLFVIFGYVLFNNYSLKSTKSKLIGVIIKLFVPYLLWQCIMAFAKIFVLGQTFESLHFIDSVFFLKVLPPNGPMYIMQPMILLGMISLVLFPLFNNKITQLPALIVVNICIMCACKILPFLSETIIGACIFHLTGSILGAYLANIEYTKKSLQELPIYIFIIGISSYVLRYNYPLVINTIICVLLLLSSCGNKYYFDEEVSFLMYSIHPVLIVVILPIVHTIFDYAIVKNVFSSLVVIVTSYLLSILALRVIKAINILLKKNKTVLNLISSNFLK